MRYVFKISGSSQDKFEHPSSARDKAYAQKTERVVCSHTFALAASSSGRRAGWAVRRFDSLVLSENPGVVLCLCVRRKGTFLHIARYKALLAPRIGAQLFLANRSYTTWGSGDHDYKQYKTRGRLGYGKFVRSSIFEVSPERAKRECVSPWPCRRRSLRASIVIPTSILVVHALLLARHHREEQLRDAAIVSIVGSFLSSSTAVACWVTDGKMTSRFGMDVPNEGFCLTPCAGSVLLITFRKCVGQPYSRTPSDRPR
jgi:hypothetical protein